MSGETYTERTRLCVQALCESLGLDYFRVAELVIEPWGISATSYLLNEEGRHYPASDGHIAREFHHFPGSVSP